MWTHILLRTPFDLPRPKTVIRGDFGQDIYNGQAEAI